MGMNSDALVMQIFKEVTKKVARELFLIQYIGNGGNI